ncbi:hypothetical protein IJZ97_06525, partial [bacterium]|nr:hypothetical protein [bacterium]
YWAGAVKACGGTSKMASTAQLGNIASYVYGTTVGERDNVYDDITYDPTKAAELGLPSSAGFFVWSGEEYASTNAYFRYFYSGSTVWSRTSRNDSGGLVVCLGD